MSASAASTQSPSHSALENDMRDARENLIYNIICTSHHTFLSNACWNIIYSKRTFQHTNESAEKKYKKKDGKVKHVADCKQTSAEYTPHSGRSTIHLSNWRNRAQKLLFFPLDKYLYYLSCLPGSTYMYVHFNWIQFTIQVYPSRAMMKIDVCLWNNKSNTWVENWNSIY